MKMKKFTSCFEISILVLAIFAFSFFLASPVSAEINYCCEKTVGGASCQNENQVKCDPNYKSTPTSCDSTSYCKGGCCYDSKEGLCMENTPKAVCDSAGGAWDEEKDCNIPQCNLGCCVIGGEASLTTLVRCKKLATFYGVEADYRSSIKDEQTCIGIANAQDLGACVYTSEFLKTCKFRTQGSCEAMKTNSTDTTFHKNYLCSNDELGTNCARQHHTGCVEGKDEVYWFDSCNNRENIYDSDKTKSWNNGKVLDKDESCNPSSSNAGSKSCGNCDYFLGSYCRKWNSGEGSSSVKPDYGEYFCRNLNCAKTSDGKSHKHGESWCATDKTANVVGSRYVKHICIQGEEIIEPCADFRQEVCIEDKVKTSAGDFNEAACRANRWQDCTGTANQQDCENSDKRDCNWIGENDKCVPLNPPGLNFWGEESDIKQICSQGNSQCIVEFEKGLISSEKTCVKNCECLDGSWKEEMNSMCNALGDCGGKVNIANKASGSSSTSSGGFNKTGWVIVGQVIKGLSGILPGALVSALGPSTEADWLASLGKNAPAEEIGFKGGDYKLYQDPAAVGGAGGGAGASSSWSQGFNKALGIGAGEEGATTLESVLYSPIVSSAAWGLIVGFAAGFIAEFAGASGKQAQTIGTAAGLGTFSGMFAVKMAWVSSATTGLIVGGVVGVVVLLAFYKQEYTQIIDFTCEPWEAPIGGKDCELCNKNKYIPCSEYRCRSLGQACQLLNAGTSNESCAWVNQNDVKSPSISPLDSALTSGYSYTDVKLRPPGTGMRIIRTSASDGCVKAFEPLTFGISVNEPSQCKVDYNHTAKFDNMQYYFGETNLYKYNHTQKMSLLGPAALKAQAPELQNDGSYTLYVRCRDANGNYNEDEFAIRFCVEKGPDTTPAKVEGTSITNSAPIGYNVSETPLELYLNEPADCKWSWEDKDYSNMEQTMSCVQNIWDMNAQQTYTCKTTLTGLKKNQVTSFYFRCKDQPWLVNGSDRNVNKQSYVFSLRTTNSLYITKVLPNETAVGTAEPLPVYLQAETENGEDKGKATCYYGTDNRTFIEFFETQGKSVHKQTLYLNKGEYTYYIKCIDLGGNIAYSSTRFAVDVDASPPLIIKAYNENGKLKIKTDEKSTCTYSPESCNFLFEEGTNMPYSDSVDHYTDWKTESTFYIKCKDEKGNEASTCSMIIYPYDVFDNE